MYAFFWKHFPIFYTLPFLLAASQFKQVAAAGEVLRWMMLFAGCAMAIQSGFSRAGLKRRIFTWADRAILAFLLLFLVSEMWTIQPWVTAQKAISMLLLYGCSFWTLWKYADHFSEQWLLRKLSTFLGIFFSINLLSGLVLPGALLVGRFRGILNNPNHIGLILGLAIPLVISQWLYTRQKLSLAIALILSLNVIACGSRSAMLGIAVATLAILISLFAKRSSQAFAISIVAVIGLALFIQTDIFTNHILRETSLSTASNRTYFWELAKTYIAHRPDFGHGFGTDEVIHSYYGTALSKLQLRGYGVMSSYYGLAIQVGWPATYCFFGLMWGFVAYCLAGCWRNYALVTLAAAIASGLVMCVFEPAITSAGNVFSFLFWAIFMLAIRRDYYQKRGLLAHI